MAVGNRRPAFSQPLVNFGGLDAVFESGGRTTIRLRDPGLGLHHGQIDCLYVTRGLLGQHDREIGCVTLSCLKSGQAGVPDGKARQGGNQPDNGDTSDEEIAA